jgi:hypothetical protein
MPATPEMTSPAPSSSSRTFPRTGEPAVRGTASDCSRPRGAAPRSSSPSVASTPTTGPSTSAT